MARRARKIEVFTIAGHIDDNPVDYIELFDALASVPVAERDIVRRDNILALPALRRRGRIVRAVVYEGPRDLYPLIYDYEQGTERIEQLLASEVLATKTHAIIDVIDRETIVEYNHRGAKARDLALLIEELGRPLLGQSLNVELSPVADESFSRSIDHFRRITSASIKLSRPNQDWTDYHDRLTGLAGESHGQYAEVAVSAGRGRSLSDGSGIIPLIRKILRRRRSSVQTAKIAGYRHEESEPTTVSLSRHITHQRIRVETDEAGYPMEPEMLDRLEEFLAERRAQGIDDEGD